MSEDSLDALITRCPNCDTHFRVSQAQLQAAAGQVRCGACLSVFDGVGHLLFDGEELDPAGCADVDDVLAELEQLRAEEAALAEREEEAVAGAEQTHASAPATPLDAAEQQVDADQAIPDSDEASISSDLAALEDALIADLHAEEEAIGSSVAEIGKDGIESSGVATPELVNLVFEVQGPSDSLEQAPPEEAMGDELPAGDAGEDPGEPVLESLPGSAVEGDSTSVTLPGVFIYDAELQEGPQREESSRSFTITGLVALLLLLGLPAQVLWFQYDAWVQDPQIRPVYVQICKAMDCELPPLRDIRLITAKKSVIRVHPTRDDARIVDVLMVNNASFAQPFPLIELRATTVRGQLIAGRRFKPAEYLQGELQAADLMPARTPVHVSLEIQDPAERAMNFEVRFR